MRQQVSLFLAHLHVTHTALCEKNPICTDLLLDYNCTIVVGYPGRNLETREYTWRDKAPARVEKNRQIKLLEKVISRR